MRIRASTVFHMSKACCQLPRQEPHTLEGLAPSVPCVRENHVLYNPVLGAVLWLAAA